MIDRHTTRRLRGMTKVRSVRKEGVLHSWREDDNDVLLPYFYDGCVLVRQRQMKVVVEDGFDGRIFEFR